VRIIRAVRFSAKLGALGFTIEPKTAAPLVHSQKLLADVPQSRLFDEMLKLLQTGHAVATIAQLRKLGMATGIYPLLDVVVERADQPFVLAALQDTDRRVGEGKPVAPSFLLACVLWADVREGWAARTGRQPPFVALQDAIEDVFNARIGDVSGRGKLAGDMRETWLMQPRFEKRVGSGPYSMIDQPRFRAAFDFMRLRADAGEVEQGIADWWQEFTTGSDDQREDLLAQAREEQGRRQKAVRVPRVVSQPRAAADQPAAADAAPASEGAAAPKKRRRRRKPGAGGAAPAAGSDA
jgi:poly(A) polymerase